MSVTFEFLARINESFYRMLCGVRVSMGWLSSLLCFVMAIAWAICRDSYSVSLLRGEPVSVPAIPFGSLFKLKLCFSVEVTPVIKFIYLIFES